MSGIGASWPGSLASGLQSFADAIEEERQAEMVRRAIALIGRPIDTRHSSTCGAPNRVFGPLRPPAPYAIGISEVDAAFWLGLCEVLCRPADECDHDYRRGWTIACRLTGLSWTQVKQALGDAHYSSAADAGQMWSRHMSPPDERYCGFVYIARASKFPDLVKIGFSTNPIKRMKSLSSQTGLETHLLWTIHATMLHEWALHSLLYPGRKMPAPEMYPIERVCSWLLPEELRVTA